MKKIHLLLLIFSCLILGCHKSHPTAKHSLLSVYDSIITIKSISDTSALLKICFSTTQIINNTALWKPTLDDWFNIPVSTDGLCHSKLDTIIHIGSDTDLQFFKTDAYDGKVKMTAHVNSTTYSVATISHHGDHYNIINFKKNLIDVGSFGNGYDTLKVENFGDDYKLICFSSGYVGNSTVTSTKTYFALSNYTEVFDFNSYRSVGDSSELDTDYYELTQHLVHIPGKYGRDDFILKGIMIYFDKHSKSYKKRPVLELYRKNDFDIYKRSSN